MSSNINNISNAPINIGYLAYKVWVAIGLHFNEKSSYDYLKFSGSTNASETAFNKHKLKWMFANIEKKLGYDKSLIEQYFFTLYTERGSFVYYNKPVIKSWLHIDKLEQNEFQKHVAKINNVDMILEDLETMKQHMKSLNKNFNCVVEIGDNYPVIYELYENKLVNYTTLIIFDIYLDFLQNSLSHVSDPFSWPKIVKSIHSQKGFYLKWLNKHVVTQILVEAIKR